MTGSAMGLLYTTWPDAQSAESAAEAVLAEGLCACANILGESRSLFRWEGEMRREREIIALFKTSPGKAARLAERLARLHPYDEPCVIALTVDEAGSAPGFLAWVRGEVGSRPG
ncbi:divalent-cation tolerance protein CutA [Hyphomonadaceae bacterium ML37]|nr:divalent-cation tolerance protein CutA [Hyphomonadaceae bacterium ML37]